MAPELSEKSVKTRIADGSEIVTPWWEIDAGGEGPTLLIVAAQHGNEVQGTETIRRFAPVCTEQLRAGTVMLVPMANLLAIRHRRNSVKIGPEEKQTELHRANNMNRLWPGDLEGNDVARVAHSLHEQIVTRATHMVDLHCWCRLWAAAVLACDVGESSRMAEIAGLRFINWSEAPDDLDLPTQLRKLTVSRGLAAITIEFSGQFCVEEHQVLGGVRALVNLARMLGMMEGEPEIPSESGIKVTDERKMMVEAPCAGLFVQAPDLKLEDRVEAGQSLGHILLDDDLSTVEITAPEGGWLWRYGSQREAPDVSLPDQHPYCDAGDTLAGIITA